jgi:glycosyltransferase involved in cell wall biosynthesis
MRVLQLGPYPPPHGGVQTNLVAIREYLRRSGISCEVINLTRHRRPDGDGVYYPKSALGLLWLLIRLRYDIIHLQIGGDLSLRLLVLGLLCNWIPFKKTVLTFHSGGYPGSPEGKTATPRTFRGFVLRRFDRLIGVNAELIELFHAFGVPPFRTRLIYPHAFPTAATELSPRLAGFFADHSPLLLTVGGLEPEYGIPFLVNAMEEILERHPGAGLAVIGSGSQEAEITRLVNSRPYGERILLCGDIPHAETMRAIQRADVLLRVTRYDGDSIAVREAMHLGTPVIASDNGMRPAGVRLVPVEDRPALLEALEAALLEKGSGKGTPVTGGEENVQAVLDLYEELLSG